MLRRRVEELVEQQLWPRSAEVDRGTTLPLDHFDALADLGLYGIAIPTRHGGLGFSGSQIRDTLRLLASGCGVTTFAFAQHHGTVGSVVSTENTALRERWLPRLADDRLAGIAYAHVRRRGAPVLTASPANPGWILNGVAPWVTSWGVASVIGVAANTEDGRLLWALISAEEAPGLTVGKAFDLMAYSATQTVALNFDGFHVDPDSVLSVVEFESWSERDRLMAARPNPLCVGIGDRALSELQRIAPDVAADFEPWWAQAADDAEAHSQSVDDALAGGVAGGQGSVDLAAFDLGAVATARAETVLATQRLTTALLAATGGAAMELGHPSQRLSREALFYVIQAQSSDGRSAMLERLGWDSADH